MNIRKFLKQLIGKGDTTPEYRDFIKTLVDVHREVFSEENLATAKDYLFELLNDAFLEQEKKIQKYIEKHKED